MPRRERARGIPAAALRDRKGDRVLLYMQNSPQFMIAYYAILRADAVVVPVSPMNVTDELRALLGDSGATTAIVAQELWPQAAAAAGRRHARARDRRDLLRLPHRSPPTSRCPMRSRRRASDHRARASPPGTTRSRAASQAGPHTARPRRPVRHALHLGHHRQTEGLHAHPPHRHVHGRRRRARGTACAARLERRSACCR